jgi:hypothetical protein
MLRIRIPQVDAEYNIHSIQVEAEPEAAGESESGGDLEAGGESSPLEIKLCCSPGEALDEVTGSCTTLGSE